MESIQKCLLLTFVLLCLVGSSWTQTNRTECTNDEQCSEYDDVGICNSGTCDCDPSLPEGCFEVNNATNMCVLTSCATFVNGTDICRLGNKSRTTALLLSIFLINFGAANFYIEKYAFAIPQILLGLLVCVFQFGACGATCTRSDSDETSVPCIVCCGINSVLSLAIFSWWLADLVIFALNDRSDGDGCPLYT